jgi:hypothetical protein
MNHLRNPAAIEIRLCGKWTDLAPDESPEEVADLDAFGEWGVAAVVVRMTDRTFRLAEPLSVTPFGPYGPMLNLGDVIEVESQPDGTFRYVRTLESGDPWSRTIPGVSIEVIERPVIHDLLEEFIAAGGMWELAVGNLTLQILSPRGTAAFDAIRRLETAFASLTSVRDLEER